MATGRVTFDVDEASAEVLGDLTEKARALVSGRRLFDIANGWNAAHPAALTRGHLLEDPIVVQGHRALHLTYPVRPEDRSATDPPCRLTTTPQRASHQSFTRSRVATKADLRPSTPYCNRASSRPRQGHAPTRPRGGHETPHPVITSSPKHLPTCPWRKRECDRPPVCGLSALRSILLVAVRLPSGPRRRRLAASCHSGPRAKPGC